MPKDVYIFSGIAHSWYGLDYRKSSEPKVIYYDEYTDKILKVANSFDDFIDRLIEVEG